MRDNPPKLNSPNNLTNPPRSSSCRYEEIPRTHPVEMIVSFSFPKVTAGLRWLVVCGYPSDRAGNPVDILRVQVFRQHERNMRAKSMLIQKRTRRGHIGDIGSSERTSSMSRMSFRGWRISRAIEPSQGDGPKSRQTRFVEGRVFLSCKKILRELHNVRNSDRFVSRLNGGGSLSSKFRSRRIACGSRDWRWIVRFRPTRRCRRPI